MREHLLGRPWKWLENEGYIVEPGGNGFFSISEEGTAAAQNVPKPKPVASPVGRAALRVEGRPTVFISYSWERDEHKEWVLHLAETLQAKGGVNVILDQWDLRMGQDKTLFMEESVAKSDFVLVVCTPEYAEKANKRRGGVGYEAMIITGELAEDIQQTKFIPVLRRGAWDRTSMPRWLTTRTGADLRGDPYKETEYEHLVMELHGEHLKPPPVGPKPNFSGSKRGQSDTNPLPAELLPTGGNKLSRAQNAIAYATYETKGPSADRVQAYVRPTDSTGVRFRLEISTGEVAEGTASEISQRYFMFDSDLQQRGYSRMTNFNGSGGQHFNLP